MTFTVQHGWDSLTYRDSVKRRLSVEPVPTDAPASVRSAEPHRKAADKGAGASKGVTARTGHRRVEASPRPTFQGVAKK